MNVLGLDEHTRVLLTGEEYKENISKIKDTVGTLLNNIMLQYYQYIENYSKTHVVDDRTKSLMVLSLTKMKGTMEDCKLFFENTRSISKGEAYAFIFGFSIPSFHFNNYLYQTFVKSIKNSFSDNDWSERRLNNYEEPHILAHEIFVDKKSSIGYIDIDFNTLTTLVESKLEISDSEYDYIKNKLRLIMRLAKVMEDYPNDYCEYTSKLFKSKIKCLVDSTFWVLENDNHYRKDRVLSIRK
jgi:hypothetical protein